MKHHYLLISLILAAFSLTHSMDSDKPKAESAFFDDVATTPKRDEALFEVDEKLFTHFLQAQRNAQKSQQVCHHLHESMGISFSSLEDFEKTMAPLVAQAENIHHGLAQLIKAFDIALNTDDSNPLPTPAVNLRKALEEKFKKYNQEWNILEKNWLVPLIITLPILVYMLFLTRKT